jgi:hypothetical protein
MKAVIVAVVAAVLLTAGIVYACPPGQSEHCTTTCSYNPITHQQTCYTTCTCW